MRRTGWVAAALFVIALSIAWSLAARRCHEAGGRLVLPDFRCEPAAPPVILERGIKRS